MSLGLSGLRGVDPALRGRGYSSAPCVRRTSAITIGGGLRRVGDAGHARRCMNIQDRNDVEALSRQLLPLSACEIRVLLGKREVSPRELIQICARRIEATDPKLNALPTLCIERALVHAQRIEDRKDLPPADKAWLGGLPVAIKDLNDVAGVRTTYGSKIFADHVPAHSDYTVQRLESNAAIVIAKSNTPEFGAGGVTFNDVFGATANPWNTRKTSGGSSGGSAAAVAAGQVWGAFGSDFGGSLRIPASFCGTVGLRPTPGCVPRGPASHPFASLWVDGPIARTAADCALLLDAMAGRDPRDPLSRASGADTFRERMRRDPPADLRIAYSSDLGLAPVDTRVRALFSQVIHSLRDVAAEFDEAHPHLSSAHDVFQVLRAAWMAGDMLPLLERHEDQLKPELVWNIRKGLALSAEEIGRAEVERGRIYRRVIEFFEQYDLLVTPATSVPAFDLGERYPQEVDGEHQETYLDWYALTYSISLTACPAISVPVGFTHDGLPLGLQIIAPPLEEARLLWAASQVERLMKLDPAVPIDPR